MVKQKVADSKSGLCFMLTLSLYGFLATFKSNDMTVFACFP